MPGPTTIVARTTIDAPPDVVWALASDTARYAEWVENTLTVLRTDGTAGPGVTMEERTRVAGPWTAVTRWRVTEWDPPHRQVHEGEGLALASDMAVIIEVAPAGAGTLFTLTLRYAARFGALGAAIDRVIRGSIARSQARSVQAFGAMVNASAGG